MARVLEGKTLAGEITAASSSRVKSLLSSGSRPPSLAAVSCGGAEVDVYLKRELAACARIGIETKVYALGEDSSTGDFSALLKRLSSDGSVDAVVVGRPLPAQLSAPGLLENLSPGKDVDGASALSLGRLFSCKNFSEFSDLRSFAPCTASAVIRLLDHYGIQVRGLAAAVVGRSPVVGRPLAHMLSMLDATVTLCHTKTKDLAAITRRSDIVVCAAGNPRWLKREMISENAIIIDVGMNSDGKGGFCGDADFEGVLSLAGAVSPVPGGVGPVTLACLLENVTLAAGRRQC